MGAGAAREDSGQFGPLSKQMWEAVILMNIIRIILGGFLRFMDLGTFPMVSNCVFLETKPDQIPKIQNRKNSWQPTSTVYP